MRRIIQAYRLRTLDLGVSTDSERVGGRQSHQFGIVEVDDFTIRLYYLNLPTVIYHVNSISSGCLGGCSG